MRKTLKAKRIDSLKPRIDRRCEVRDPMLPGFSVRVSVTGSRIRLVTGRVDGRQARHTLDTYPIVSFAEARETARAVLREIQLGAYAPAKAEAPLTLKDVMADFIIGNRTTRTDAGSLQSSPQELESSSALRRYPVMSS